MTVRQHIEHVLLAFGVGTELVAILGLVVMRDVFDRIHYAMAGTALGPLLIGAAIIVHESLDQSGINTLLVSVLLFLLGPVLANAVARAGRARRFGQVAPRREEVERAE